MVMRDAADVAKSHAIGRLGWVEKERERSGPHGGAVARGALATSASQSPMRASFQISQCLQGTRAHPGDRARAEPGAHPLGDGLRFWLTNDEDRFAGG